MQIGNFVIGSKTMLIAEIGGNHDGDFQKAQRLIKKAVRSGADAVKFQTYKAERLVDKALPVMSHVKSKNKTQFERFKSLEFSPDEWRQLHGIATSLGLIFLSTPFDNESADLLDGLVPAYKVASPDLTNLHLIRHIVKKGKPILLSTGMATVEDIELALKEIPKDRVILLHCVSSYPVRNEDINLRSIPFLRDKFGLPVGYSDHSISILACLGAVALGAVLIEKHFTLDKTKEIGDHKLSAEPEEFAEMARQIRELELFLGDYAKGVSPSEMEVDRLAKRSLYAAVEIKKGEILTSERLIPLRPAGGISAKDIDAVLGKSCARFIQKGERLREDDIKLF